MGESRHNSFGRAGVLLPSPKVGPLAAVLYRVLIALGLVLLVVVVVIADRGGYRDSADGHVSVLDAMYYATVTMSTTGYGDITPVSDAARLTNVVVITPLRIAFLIILVGTTLEVLATRTREDWRLSRWRSHLKDHSVVVGYGTKGRSAIESLLSTGIGRDQIVVVELVQRVADEAAGAGFTAVIGDATQAQVLRRAELPSARRVIITTRRDDTSVLVTLTARQLNAGAMIAVSVREEENGPLLRQSGADRVITSSEASGRLVGMSACQPHVSRVFEDLLERGRGLDLIEREVTPDEVGRSLREIEHPVLAVVRDNHQFSYDAPEAKHLLPGDRLVVVSAGPQ